MLGSNARSWISCKPSLRISSCQQKLARQAIVDELRGALYTQAVCKSSLCPAWRNTVQHDTTDELCNEPRSPQSISFVPERLTAVSLPWDGQHWGWRNIVIRWRAMVESGRIPRMFFSVLLKECTPFKTALLVPHWYHLLLEPYTCKPGCSTVGTAWDSEGCIIIWH